MSESKIAKEYSKLKAKHKLPSLEDIEHDFGLHDIESDKFPLVEIRKKMHDKIDTFCQIISNLLEGEASLSSIYEAKILTEKNKADIFRLYKKLMGFSRQSSILSLSYNEDIEAQFIKEFTSEWNMIKEELKKYLVLLKEAWEEDSETTEEIINYLG